MFFESKSQAMVNAVLRSGSVSGSDEFTEAFHQTLAMLPEHSRIDYVRVDAGFAGDEIYDQKPIPAKAMWLKSDGLRSLFITLDA